jgi:hypothetical protein
MHVTGTQLAMENEQNSEATTVRATTLVDTKLNPASDCTPVDFVNIIMESQIDLLNLIPGYFAEARNSAPATNQRLFNDDALNSVLAMILSQQLAPPTSAVAASSAPLRFSGPRFQSGNRSYE